MVKVSQVLQIECVEVLDLGPDPCSLLVTFEGVCSTFEYKAKGIRKTGLVSVQNLSLQ